MGTAFVRGFKVWALVGFSVGKWVGGIALIIGLVCGVIFGLYGMVVGIKAALIWSLWSLLPMGLIAWLLVIALTGAISLSNDKARLRRGY